MLYVKRLAHSLLYRNFLRKYAPVYGEHVRGLSEERGMCRRVYDYCTVKAGKSGLFALSCVIIPYPPILSVLY